MTARLSARGLNLRFHFHAACGVGSAAKGVDVGQFAFRRNLENGAIRRHRRRDGRPLPPGSPKLYNVDSVPRGLGCKVVLGDEPTGI